MILTSISEKPQIALIAGFTFNRLVKKNKQVAEVFKLTTYELNQVLKEPTESIVTKNGKIKALVPSKFYNYLSFFKKAIVEILPPHCPYNYKITLKEDFVPLFGPLYSLSKSELQAL